MKFTPENFKKLNSYYLHLKYPERDANDNWFHSCEILNRFYLQKTYLVCLYNKREIYSTKEWYKNFSLDIDNNILVVFIPNAVKIISIPLPIELPNYFEKNTFIFNHSGLKKLAIEN